MTSKREEFFENSTKEQSSVVVEDGKFKVVGTSEEELSESDELAGATVEELEARLERYEEAAEGNDAWADAYEETRRKLLSVKKTQESELSEHLQRRTISGNKRNKIKRHRKSVRRDIEELEDV